MAIKLGKRRLGKAAKGLGRFAEVASARGFKGGMRGRRHKKTANWYLNEIRRIKLKRKYERIKFGGR